MWKIPEIWKEGTCIVIGGGTSLIEQFGIPSELVSQVYAGEADISVYSPYLSPIHNHHIIAVNMAFKLGNWVDCMFFGDTGFWKKRKAEILKFQGLRVTCATDVTDDCVKVIQKNHRNKRGITFHPRMISWNFNSGAAAINLAINFGAKRIILLGFDMYLDSDNNQHWHKVYKSPLNTVQDTMKKHLAGFPVIAEDIQGKGIEIINCSPKSSITCFRKANIWEVLK